MKDERIQATTNRCAAGGSCIYYLLLTTSLLYRMLILEQHIRYFWDIFVILIIGAFFVFGACARRGALDHEFKRKWGAICISACIGALAVQFFLGRMRSIVDVGVFLVGFLPGMGLCIGIAHFLNWRWKRKEGIED